MSDPPTSEPFTATPTPTPNLNYAVSCVESASPDRVFDVATSVICGLYLALGLLLILFGYRLFKFTLFSFGFLLGATALYAICQTKAEFLGAEGNYGVAVAAGLLCGLIAALVRWIGLFLAGLATGILTAIGACIVCIGFSLYDPASSSGVWLAIGILLGCGLTSAILALYFQKTYSIAGSSSVGAALISVGADFFVESFFLRDFVWKVVVAVERKNINKYRSFDHHESTTMMMPMSDEMTTTTTTMATILTNEDDVTMASFESASSSSSFEENPGANWTEVYAKDFAMDGRGAEIDLDDLFCWYTWIILAAWPTLALFGLLFQHFVTGRDYDHRGPDAGICGTNSRAKKRARHGSSAAGAVAGGGGGGSGGASTDDDFVNVGNSSGIENRPRSPRSPKRQRHNREGGRKNNYSHNQSHQHQQKSQHRFQPISTRDAGSVRGAPPTSLSAGLGGGGSEFRHLYHKRRAAGDVISKDYIQSIHAQKSPGACSSSSSASTARGLAASSAASFDISTGVSGVSIGGGGGVGGGTSSHAISGLTDLESTLNSQHSRQSRSSQRSAATTSLSQHSVATMQSNIP